MRRFSLGLAFLVAGACGDPAGPAEPTSSADPLTAADAGPVGCEEDPQLFLRESCGATGFCHGRNGTAQNLDLASEGLASRLLDVNATSMRCTERLLVDTRDIDNSFLLDKLTLEDSELCGVGMPYGKPPLPESDISCIRNYLEELADLASAQPQEP